MFVMFDLKDTAVFMYMLYIDIYFYVGWSWRSSRNKNCKQKFCSVRSLFTNVNASLHSLLLRRFVFRKVEASDW